MCSYGQLWKTFDITKTVWSFVKVQYSRYFLVTLGKFFLMVHEECGDNIVMDSAMDDRLLSNRGHWLRQEQEYHLQAMRLKR